MNKQIEEMAKAIMKHCKIDNQCGSCHWSTCNECLADVLYNAGYRKASEVAREIFEEIESLLKDYDLRKFEIYTSLFFRISELKKKYMEGEST